MGKMTFENKTKNHKVKSKTKAEGENDSKKYENDLIRA